MENFSSAIGRPLGIDQICELNEPIGKIFSPLAEVYLAAINHDADLVKAAMAVLPSDRVETFVKEARVYRVNTLRAMSGITHSVVRASAGLPSDSAAGSSASGGTRSSTGSAGTGTSQRGMLRVKALGEHTSLSRLPNGLCYLKGVVAHKAEEAYSSLNKNPTLAKILSRPADWYHSMSQLNTLGLRGKGVTRHLGAKGDPYGDVLREASAGRDWPKGSLGATLVAQYPGRQRSSDDEIATRVGGSVIVPYPDVQEAVGFGPRVFLAGLCETDRSDGWRGLVVDAVSQAVFYTPRPFDLQVSWAAYCDNEPVRSRVTWEQSKMSRADIVFFNFTGAAPVGALVELGAAVAMGKIVIVVCPDSYPYADAVRQQVVGKVAIYRDLSGAVLALRSLVGAFVAQATGPDAVDPWSRVLRDAMGGAVAHSLALADLPRDGVETRVLKGHGVSVLVFVDAATSVPLGFLPGPEVMDGFTAVSLLVSTGDPGRPRCFSLGLGSVLEVGEPLKVLDAVGVLSSMSSFGSRAGSSYNEFCRSVSSMSLG